jgi:hypothetical protein
VASTDIEYFQVNEWDIVSSALFWYRKRAEQTDNETLAADIRAVAQKADRIKSHPHGVKVLSNPRNTMTGSGDH